MISKRFNFKTWKGKDWILFFIIIPFFMILIYLLPQKSILILNTNNPTVLSIFFSNYVHTTFWHLFSNLSSYLLIMLFLFKTEHNRKRLYFVSIFLFLMLPFILSLLPIVTFPKNKNLLGFSGIVSAFLGYLVFSIYSYLKKNYYAKLELNFMYLLLFLSIFVWAIVNFFKLPFLLSLPIIGYSIFLLYQNRNSIKKIYTELMDRNIFERVFLVCLFSYLLSSGLFLMPLQIRDGGNDVNIVIHWFGYCLGVLVALVFSHLKKH